MLNSAEIILCRTGYSSLMDLLKVGTKAILIPTPGQPEQISLGERLKEHSQFVVQGQGEVDVVEGVKKLRTSRSPVQKHSADGLLAKAIRALQLRLG
jgi:predicted glycosyltransferase